MKSDRLLLRGAIFDIDGTVIDSMGMWNECGARYLTSLGIPVEKDLARKLNLLPIEESGVFIKEHYSLPDSPAEITRGINRLAENFYQTEAKLKPFLLPFLTALSEAKISAVAATASDTGVIERALTHLGVRPFFSAIYSCRDLGYPKTDPACYVECRARLGVGEEGVWVFEDMLHAAKSAKKAGLYVGGMFDLPSADKEEELRQTADFFFKTEADFAEFCRRASLPFRV